MQARDVMTTWVATIGQEATVREAAKLMLERGVSALPVQDQKDRLVGIISEGDLVRRVELGTDQVRSWWLRLLAMTGENAAADSSSAHMRGRTSREFRYWGSSDSPLKYRIGKRSFCRRANFIRQWRKTPAFILR